MFRVDKSTRLVLGFPIDFPAIVGRFISSQRFSPSELTNLREVDRITSYMSLETDVNDTTNIVSKLRQQRLCQCQAFECHWNESRRSSGAIMHPLTGFTLVSPVARLCHCFVTLGKSAQPGHIHEDLCFSSTTCY